MRLSDRFELTGRVAVVTTGPGGFGGGCARALGLAGAAVALLSPDAEEGEHLVAQLREEGVDAAFVRSGPGPEQAAQALDAVLLRFGRVDVLVNTAEESAPGPAVDLTNPDWRRVMDHDLDAVWTWTQTFGRVFVAQRHGVVVNIGSLAGTIAGRPHWDHALAASKAAVHHLTRSLAAEWAPHGVRVNALAPGYVSVDGGRTEDPRVRRHVLEDTPMERVGTVEEITPAVVFLASDASSFITGTVLVADGGYGTC